MCARTRSPCVPSQRGPVHVWWVGLGGWGRGCVGGHGLIKRADEKNSMPFVSEKQRLL